MTLFQPARADPEEVAAVFDRVAEEVGGSRPSTPGWGQEIVQLPEGDSIVTLERVQVEAGVETRVRAFVRDVRGVRFTLRERRFFDGVMETLGFVVEVDLGVPAFDDRFLLKGYPAATVREVLKGPVHEMLLAQPRVDLRLVESVPWPPFPPGVHQLQFRQRGEILDVHRLVSLVDLFRTLLPRLDPSSRGYEDDPQLLVERLLAPGGEVRAAYTNILEWDGHAPRREAARLLGEVGDASHADVLLSVLDEDDRSLVIEAARALGKVGAEEAVPHLVSLLGEVEAEAAGETVAEAAADALDTLGHGRLARAFREALAGEPAPLKEASGPYRRHVIEALMAVVDSFDFAARVRAAEALGTLGANEALPLLRSKMRNLGMKTKLTEAARAAVEEIESRASLVRPADAAAEDTDTHPRPAGGPDVDTDALPRAAEADDEG